MLPFGGCAPRRTGFVCVRSSAARLTVVRPAELQAPEGVSARERVEGDVEVTWEPSEYAARYRVYRKAIGSDNSDAVMLADVSGTTYYDKSAVSENCYVYVVRCVKTDGSPESAFSADSNEITFYGNNVTVSFEANGARSIAAQTLVKMQKAAKPETPKYGTYWFTGWYTDREMTTLFNFDTQVAEDITLYAKWVKPDFITPAKLTEIGEEAFANIGATAVRLRENVVSIGNRAFAGCSALSAIYIPAATKTIADDTFAGNNAFTTIIGKAGSAAEEFAKAHGYEFQIGS